MNRFLASLLLGSVLGVAARAQDAPPEQIKPEPAELVAVVLSDDDKAADKAAEELVACGADAVKPLLDALLAGQEKIDLNESAKRSRLTQILIRINDPSAIALVKAPFLSPHTNVWIRNGLKKLLLVAGEESAKAVYQWISDPKAKVEEFAIADSVEILHVQGGEWAEKKLLEDLGAKNPPAHLARSAMRFLALRQNAAAGRVLLGYLEQKKYVRDPVFLGDLVRAMGDLKVREAVPRLIEEIRDPENKLYVALYAEALGTIGGQEAGRELMSVCKAYLDRSEIDNARSVLPAIGKSGHAPAAELVLPLLDHKDLRVAAMQTLGALKCKKAVLALEKHLDDPKLQMAAVSALNEITGKNFGYTNGYRRDEDRKALADLRAYLREHAAEWKE